MDAKHEFDVDDPRLSAYALGELDESERAAVEKLLAHSAAARAFVEELRKTAAALEDGFKTEAKPGLTEQQRASIVAGGAPAAPKRARPAWRKWAYAGSALAASLAIAVGVATWKLTGAKHESVMLQAVASGAASPSKPALALPPLQQASAPGYRNEGRANQVLLGSSRGDEEVRLVLPNACQVSRTVIVLGYTGGEDLLKAKENAEAYAPIVENPFILTRDEPVSTFSIDVDTASYANVRRFLLDGQRPPPDAVRIEELINYFDYDYPKPTGDNPFAVNAELVRCPWNAEHWLMRVALKGREVARHERNASNLVFLLDVSGSMDEPRKLPLVVQSLKLLVNELDARDRIAIVVYAGSSGLVLDSTSARERATIVEALERLRAGGSTNGGEGVQLAYSLAREHFVQGGANRVILCTDGDFNVGTTSQEALLELIESERKSGVFLSVLGFGTGNLKDQTMEMLADKGNGNYAYIDSLTEARKVLVEQIGGTLETIAKDVKIQVAINPAKAQAYRLIGYENRVMANEDFADDTKDAGEIGAGHCVTALYEIVPLGVPFTPPAAPAAAVEEVKAPGAAPAEKPEFGSELALLKLRFKAPDGDESRLISSPLDADPEDFAAASPDFRFAAAVAAFGMKLRGSAHTAELTYQAIHAVARAALGRDERGYRVEFLDLVQRAHGLR